VSASGNCPEFELPLQSEDGKLWGLAVPITERDCVCVATSFSP
jgi:hypothetical protein